jgi:hypothetical protein
MSLKYNFYEIVKVDKICSFIACYFIYLRAPGKIVVWQFKFVYVLYH